MAMRNMEDVFPLSSRDPLSYDVQPPLKWVQEKQFLQWRTDSQREMVKQVFKEEIGGFGSGSL